MAATADIFAPQVVGTPTIATSEPVEMLGPDGEVKIVQGRHAGTMSALGYQRVTPEIRQQLDDKARLGGTIGEMAAAGLGFARGSTLGLSDLAARGAENAGILPEGTTEDIRKLKEINPNASLAGELTSFITPGLGAIKALGTTGKVARGMGAAQAAVGGVGNALGTAAAKIAGKELGKYVAPAVRTAAEAAIFQAGQNISENVLANKELTAEAVLANTGEAAILGGGLGIGIPLALRGAQRAATAALDSAPVRWATDKVGSQFAKFLDPQHALKIYSGAEGRSALLQNTPKGKRFGEGVKGLWESGAYQSGEVALDDATAKIIKTGDGGLLNRRDMADRFSSLETQAGKIMGNTIDQADDLIRAGAKPKSFGFTNADADNVIEKIAKMSKSARINDVQELALISQLEQDALRIRDAGSFRELHELRRGIDSRISDRGWEAIGKPATEISKDVRRLVSDKIAAGLGEVNPALLDRWGNANKMFGNLKVVGDALQKQVTRAEANVNVLGLRFRDIGIGAIGGGVLGGPAGVGLAMANKALQTDQGLLARAMLGERMASIGWLQKATQAAEGNIAKSVSGFLKGVDAAAIGGSISRRPQLAGALAASDALTPDVRQGNDAQWFADTSGQIARVMADPESFAEEQGARLGAIVDHAPQTSDAIISKQLQIYSYLGDVMPKNPGRPTSILAPTWRPNEYQINEFRDVVRVARKPLSILQDLQHGTATRAQTKAIQTLYPSLYEKMLEQVREQLSRPNASLPYEKELRLGVLFPGAVPSMTGAFILSMSTGAAEAEEPSTRSGYRAGGAGKMKVGTRTSTKVDALSER